MIFDDIKQLSRYSHIPFIEDVIRFLHREDVVYLKEPEIEIRGRDVFVRIMRYQPKPAQENKFETHRVYADVQVMLKGKEIMQIARPQDLKSTTEYDRENDYQFFAVDKNISDLVVDEGQCAVFFPGEPHRPSCRCPDYDGENLKLVFKIRMGKS
jgi:biofilm protein TabA